MKSNWSRHRGFYTNSSISSITSLSFDPFTPRWLNHVCVYYHQDLACSAASVAPPLDSLRYDNINTRVYGTYHSLNVQVKRSVAFHHHVSDDDRMDEVRAIGRPAKRY